MQVAGACIRLGGGVLSRSASVAQRGAVDEIVQTVAKTLCRIYDLSTGVSPEMKNGQADRGRLCGICH